MTITTAFAIIGSILLFQVSADAVNKGDERPLYDATIALVMVAIAWGLSWYIAWVSTP